MTLNKNYIVYWSFVPIIMLLGLVYNKTVDFLVHDTFIVTDRIQISIFTSILLTISGLGYFIFRKKGVNEKLTKTHNRLTVIGIVIIVTLMIIKSLLKVGGQNQDFIEYRNIEWSIQILLGQLLGIGLIVIGFIVYLFNIIITIIKFNPRKGKR